MVATVADRVAENSSTTGTGNFTLTGALVGYRSFNSAFTAGTDTPYYAAIAVDANGNPAGQWEVGQGTLSAATTLQRTTILDNSAGNTIALNFLAAPQIWCVVPARTLLSGLNLVTKNAGYTFVASDPGSEFAHTDTNNYTWTIDTFANAPILAGQKIAGFNSSTGTLTINAPAGGSLTRLDGTAGTGNRTIGASSYFVIHKLDNSNAWGITGTALS